MAISRGLVFVYVAVISWRHPYLNLPFHPNVMSQTSIGSLVSVSSLHEEDAFTDSADENLLPAMFTSNGKTDGPPAGQLSQYQVFAMAIKCGHNSMLVSCLHTPTKTTGLWLPYVGSKESYKFKYKATRLVAEYLLRELK